MAGALDIGYGHWHMILTGNEQIRKKPTIFEGNALLK